MSQSIHSFSFHRSPLFDERFRLHGVLGRGTFGTVVKAIDTLNPSQPVALKIFHLHHIENERVVERMRNELALARKLTHENILRYDSLSRCADGQLYVSMEFVDGPDLAHLTQLYPPGAMPLNEALALLRQIACGLSSAHQQGVVHRDLKPMNILVTQRGIAKIADFSLAAAIGEGDRGLTRTGEMLGTPYYMAPEQFRARTVDARADIYAFGLVAFEILAGQKAFSSQSLYHLAEMHATQPLPSLRGLRPDVPSWFEQLVVACTEKNPELRPSRMDEVYEKLSDGIASAQCPSLLTPWRLLVRQKGQLMRRRRRVLRAVAGVFAFGMIRLLAGQFPYSAYALSASVSRHLPVLAAAPLRLALAVPPFENDTRLLHRLILNRDTIEEESGVICGLLAGGVSAAADGEDGSGLVLAAIRADSGAVVHALLESGVNPSWRGSDGGSFLHYAILHFRWIAAGKLLELYYHWDTADTSGRTPLHLAAALAPHATFIHLLEARAPNGELLFDRHARTLAGETPLHFATRRTGPDGRAQVLSLLEVSDVRARDSKSRTALQLAIESLRPDIVVAMAPRLSQIDPEVLNLPGDHGYPPIITAARIGLLDEVQALLQAGADSCRLGADGRTLEEVALPSMKDAISQAVEVYRNAHRYVCAGESSRRKTVPAESKVDSTATPN